LFLVEHPDRVDIDRHRLARFRFLIIPLAAATLAACSTRSLSGIDAATAGPAIDTAVAECEAQYRNRALTSYEQVAQCEEAVALPEQQREGPYLTGLYEVAWSNKIELYRMVDAGALAKPEADRQQAIDSRNMIVIIRSIRRF